MQITTYSPEHTARVAREFAGKLNAGDFVALYGGIGAGKTHFVKGIGEALCPGEDITSPTFAFVHEHQGDTTLYHFDMYRITGEQDLYSTGFYDYMDGRSIIVAEWSENIPFALPESYWHIELIHGAHSDERIISVRRINGGQSPLEKRDE